MRIYYISVLSILDSTEPIDKFIIILIDALTAESQDLHKSLNS